MKFKCRIVIIISLLLNSFLFSQNFGDKIYKEVELNGEKVFKWLQYSSYYEFNDKGNCVYKTSYNENKEGNNEEWFDYDERGNKIHHKSISYYGSKRVSETFYEYNLDNKLIYTKSPLENGKFDETWYKYDTNGNEIYYKTILSNFERYSDYDSNNNLIHTKLITGNNHLNEEWYEYNSNNKLIHFQSIYDNEVNDEEWNEYDKNGNLIHSKDFEGNEIWNEYDSLGNLIHSKKSNSEEEFFEYDSKGNKIHYTIKHTKDYSTGSFIDYEIFYEYDEKKRLLHERPVPEKAAIEFLYEYDSDGNVFHYKSSFGENWREYETLPNGNRVIKLFSVF